MMDRKQLILDKFSKIRDTLFMFHEQLQSGSKNKEWARILLEKTDRIIDMASDHEESLRPAYEELILLYFQAIDENKTFEKWLKSNPNNPLGPLPNSN